MNRRGERGNVFFTLFGAVALVGVVAASTTTLMRGPLGTVMTLNQQARVEAQLQIARRMVALEAANLENNCDGDNAVEPLPPKMTGTDCTNLIEGGGCLPDSVGAAQNDPWGTPVAYCGWNHGAINSGSGCSSDLLEGDGPDYADFQAQPVIAVISAGPSRSFQTACRNAPDYIVNNNPDSDDIILVWNYAEVGEGLGGAGGLWRLKSDDPSRMVPERELDSVTFADDATATFRGAAAFETGSMLDLSLGGLLNLPDHTNSGPCNGGNDGMLRANKAAGRVLQICNVDADPDPAWIDIGGEGATISAAGDEGKIQFNLDGEEFGASPALVWNNAAGRLEIGAPASPSRTLDVAGTGRISGAVLFGSTLDVTGLATLESDLLVKGDAALEKDLAVDGATTLGGTLDVDGVTTVDAALNVINDQPTNLTGTLDVGGIASFAAQARASAGTAAAPGYAFTTGTDTGLFYEANVLGLSAAGTERLRLTTTGAEVTGALGVTGTASASRFIAGSGTAESPAFQASSGTGMYSDGGSLRLATFETPRLTITPEGNVGIGTTPNPSIRLDVTGALRPGQTADSCDGGTMAGALRYDPGEDQLEFCSTSGSWFAIGAEGGGGSGSSSKWSDASGSRIYYQAGNVGIGTNDPLSTLHVDGTVRAVQYCDENGNFCMVPEIVTDAGLPAGDVGEIQFHGADGELDASSDLFWDNDNSRLGIGTGDPKAMLDVAGGVRIGPASVCTEDEAGHAPLQQ